MAPTKKLSMNTSLKNARIFDDAAWEEKDGKEVKKEIKKEVKKEPKWNLNMPTIQESLGECSQTKIKIKRDLQSYGEYSKNNIFRDSFEDKELRDSNESSRESLLRTPPSPSRIKTEPSDDVFNDSPYNKDIFKTLKIKEETPIKTDIEDATVSSRNALKSAKRTVFTRNSPYKRPKEEVDDNYEKRMSAKSRLGPKVNDSKMPSKKMKKTTNFESDHEIITRRQKQIEYGKNTVGYDNYTKSVPRDKRTPEDPQTPPKYKKYSRRGWDGLIKQWRLRLHKYDPVDT